MKCLLVAFVLSSATLLVDAIPEDSDSTTVEPDPVCGNCEAKWTFSNQDLGGIECEHGEDTDKQNCKDKFCYPYKIVNGEIVVIGDPTGSGDGGKYFPCCEVRAGKKCPRPRLGPDGKPVRDENGKIIWDIYTVPGCGGRTKDTDLPGVCRCYDCKDGCEGLIMIYEARCGGILNTPDKRKCEKHAAVDKFGKAEHKVVRVQIKATLPTGVKCKGGPGATNGHKEKYQCGNLTIHYADCLSTTCKLDPNYKFPPQTICMKNGKPAGGANYPWGSAYCGPVEKCGRAPQ